MSSYYKPRQMPARFLEGAPDIVRKNVLDIIGIVPAAPLDFDVLLRPDPAPYADTYVTGIDFGRDGARGCHFELHAYEARGYRERTRRNRVAWRDLPEPTRAAVLAYLAD